MNELMEQRVMSVTTVEPVVAPGPDGRGQWRVTATSDDETVTLLVCNPPVEGAYVFVEVVAIETAAPAGGGF